MSNFKRIMHSVLNAKLLGISAAALLVFGILAQVLSEKMGYTPLLDDYMMYLIPTVAIGFLTFFTVLWLRRGGKRCHRVLALLLAVILIWSIFMCGGFLHVQFGEYYQHTTYGNGWYLGYADLQKETQYMLSKCILFGHGEEYYAYPDTLAETEQYFESLPEEAQQAHMERHRAERVFCHFRWDVILPVLSYIYGFWITVLFTTIAVAWCIGAIGTFRRLHLWWEKAVYIACALVMTEQVILPLLCGYGIVAGLIPHPFSMDWRISILAVAPQLGVMFALPKTSKPRIATEITTEERTAVSV